MHEERKHDMRRGTAPKSRAYMKTFKTATETALVPEGGRQAGSKACRQDTGRRHSVREGIELVVAVLSSGIGNGGAEGEMPEFTQ